MKRNCARDQKSANMNTIKCLGKQKNVGGKTKETAAKNKRGPFGEGLELVRGTQESQSKAKETAAKNKNKTAGEGLELLRETEESHL